MIYTDICLRAGTEAEMVDALPWARGTDEDGNAAWQASGSGWALDAMGPLVLIPGSYDPDTGEEITPPMVDDGFHVNLRTWEGFSEVIPDTVILDPQPASPSRIFA